MKFTKEDFEKRYEFRGVALFNDLHPELVQSEVLKQDCFRVLESLEDGGLKAIKISTFLSDDPTSNIIFERDFFQDLLTVIRRRKNVVLIGNPGIGKSYFQYYYILRVLYPEKFGPLPPDSFGSTEPPLFIVRQVGDSKLETYDIKNKTVTTTISAKKDITTYLEKFDPRSTLYFYEPDLSKSEPHNVLIPTLLTVSPNVDRYKEFLKQKKGYKYYMPNWSSGDIISANCLLNSGLSSKVLKERYEDFGGIFRHIFADEEKLNVIRSERRSKIEDLDAQKLLAATTIENTSVSHLVAQFSDIPTNGSYPFQSFNLKFVSAVKEDIIKKLRNISIEEKINILIKSDETGSSLDKYNPKIYEEVALNLLLEGVQWKSRCNELNSKYESFNTKFDTKELGKPNLNNLKERVYYSTNVNYKFVDIVFKDSDGSLAGIQLSREKSARRKIKNSVLQKFIDDNNINKFTYYYCPPPQLSDQAIIYHDKNPATDNACIKWRILKVPKNYTLSFNEVEPNRSNNE